MRQAKRNQYIAEGIAVLVVLVVLVVVTVPKFEDAQTTADVAKVKRDMKDVGDALILHGLDHTQIAADVAKVKRDMEEIGNALILYGKNNGGYPFSDGGNLHSELNPLTTPVAYLAVMPTDPFRREYSRYKSATSNYDYTRVRLPSESKGMERQAWLLGSLGPDLDEETGLFGRPQPWMMYDSSNGILSSGDLFWTAYDCDAVLTVPKPTPGGFPGGVW